MYKRVREFIEFHIDRISAIFVIAIIVLWILSQYIPALKDWMVRQNLLSVITVVLLTDAITRLVEIKHGARPGRAKVFRSQLAASDEVRQFIKQNRPKKVKLLEYSSETIGDLLGLLKEADSDIQLLLKDPETAVTSFQEGRIQVCIDSLLALPLGDYRGKIEMRCYRVPASLRGRNFDNTLISVGWYTYSFDLVGVYGHTNPMINAYTDSEEGRTLQTTFDSIFDSLWKHPSKCLIACPAPIGGEPEPNPQLTIKATIRDDEEGLDVVATRVVLGGEVIAEQVSKFEFTLSGKGLEYVYLEVQAPGYEPSEIGFRHRLGRSCTYPLLIVLQKLTEPVPQA